MFRTRSRNTQASALKILSLLTCHTTEVPPRKKIVLCRVWCLFLFYSYCLSFPVSQNRYDRSFWKCSSLSRPMDSRSTVAAVLIAMYINVNGQNHVCSVYLLTLKTHLFIHSILKRKAVNLVTENKLFLTCYIYGVEPSSLHTHFICKAEDIPVFYPTTTTLWNNLMCGCFPERYNVDLWSPIHWLIVYPSSISSWPWITTMSKTSFSNVLPCGTLVLGKHQ